MTDQKNDPILQPFKMGNLTIKNRIFSTGHALSHTIHGKPTPTTKGYQLEKAKGGIGLSFIGGSGTISIDTAPVFDQIIIDKTVIPFFQDLSEEYHKHGAAIMTQITHLGRRTNSNAGEWLPMMAPSAIRETLHRGIPREMDREDIDRIVQAFAVAARNCKEGGLDGLEIIASGHLLDQFWSPVTNKRTDDFGGSLDNRMRFSRMVYEAMREAVGDDFALGIRMTMSELDDDGEGLSEDDNLEIAQRLKSDGVLDFLDLVSGRIDNLVRLSRYMPGLAAPLSPFLEQAGRFKKEIDLPVFHATRVNDISTARYAVREGLLDMVGMTRAHIADPHLVNKIIRGEEDRIRTCVGATYCSNYQLCIQNPATARETTLPHLREEAKGPKRKVVIVGGGPAGMEAARVCAQRGHDVTLFEAANELGGQVILAAKVKWRRDLIGIRDWLAREIEHLGVDIRLNTYAEEQEILAEKPDIVINAAGGTPNTDLIKGDANILTTWDILSGDAKPEGDVLIHDMTGKNVALAAADYMSDQGARVEYATHDATIGMEAMRMEISTFMKHFYKKDVRMTPDHEIIRAVKKDNRIEVTLRNTHTSEDIKRTVDHLVIEAGTLPNDMVFYDLKENSLNKGVADMDAMAAGTAQPLVTGEGYHLFRVGDAVNSRDIHCAMLDSLRICKDL